MTRIATSLLSLSIFALLTPNVGAQPAANGAAAYPARAIRMIVPFAPSGPTDVIARIIAHKMSERTGQPVYIENQGGAAGNIGMGAAARAQADGYTLLIAGSNFLINPNLFESVPYDPFKGAVRDVVGIGVARSPII